MTLDEVEDRLIEWSAWALTALRPPNGIPTETALYKLQRDGCIIRGGRHILTGGGGRDERAEAINKILQHMQDHDRRLFDVIKITYYPIRKGAKAIKASGLPKSTYYARLDEAKRYIAYRVV